jgi:hypothetical protein
VGDDFLGTDEPAHAVTCLEDLGRISLGHPSSCTMTEAGRHMASRAPMARAIGKGSWVATAPAATRTSMICSVP